MKFPVSVAISAHSGRHAVALEHVREFYDYMAGVHVPIWDISRFRRTLVPELLRQHPGLSQPGCQPVKEYKGDPRTKWIKDATKQLGAPELEFRPMPTAWRTRTLEQYLSA